MRRGRRRGTGVDEAQDLRAVFRNNFMKKTLAIVIMGLLTAGGQVYGQNFQWGVKGGGNLSTFMGSGNQYYSSFSMQAGWNAGIFTNFFLGSHFAIAPELLFTREGAKINTTSSQNTVSVGTNSSHFRVDYLSLPVMAKFRFDGGFFIETGPEFSINISNSHWQDQSVRDLTNNAEFGWGAGVGYQSPIGLGIGLRYNLGITKVDNTSQAGWNDVSLRNSGFMLDLFWAFFNNKNLSQSGQSGQPGQ